jgi:hypothetical protein
MLPNELAVGVAVVLAGCDFSMVPFVSVGLEAGSLSLLVAA